MTVVAVFVGDEDSLNVIQGPVDFSHQALNLFPAQTGVNQDPVLVSFQVSNVASASAGENAVT